jgi:putative transposase
MAIYDAARSIIGQGTASEREVSEVLGFSRTAMQRSAAMSAGRRETSDKELLPMVIEIFTRHRRRYGKRRVVAELSHRGIHCGHERIAKLMKIADLKAIQPKSFKPRTTESRHTLGYNDNLLLSCPEPSKINQLWVGDITYVPITGQGFGYLSTLMDRYSRRLVGWSFGMDMTERLVADSLRRSIGSRQPPVDLIHHTDRGGQYASRKYRAILDRASMRQSMSRAGDCYDNAFMESCFGTIKTELQMTEYQSYQDALTELSEFIEYYNFERLHSSIGYLSPSRFEATVTL